MNKQILFIVFLCILIAGCAAFKKTIGDIKEDPVSFQTEVNQMSTAITAISPVPIGAAGVAAGYLIAFLRRMYVNYKKEEAIKLAMLKTKANST